MSIWRRVARLVGIVVVLDQLTKLWVKLTLPLGYEKNLIGGWLKLHFVENPGAAFGISLAGFFGQGTSTAEAAPKVLLTLFSTAIAVGIGYYLLRLCREESRFIWPSALSSAALSETS